MRNNWITAVLAAAALTGCSTMADQAAVTDAKAKCSAKGMQFYQTEDHRQDLVVAGGAEVKGECVAPGDPRYVQGR